MQFDASVEQKSYAKVIRAFHHKDRLTSFLPAIMNISNICSAAAYMVRNLLPVPAGAILNHWISLLR